MAASSCALCRSQTGFGGCRREQRYRQITDPGKAGEHCLKCRGVLVGEALIIEPLEKLPEGCDLHATFGRPFYAEITLVDNNTGSPSGLDQAVANEAEQTVLIFRRETIERELFSAIGWVLTCNARRMRPVRQTQNQWRTPHDFQTVPIVVSRSWEGQIHPSKRPTHGKGPFAKTNVCISAIVWR